MTPLPLIDFAPIQGVTNELYRELFHQCFAGVDRYYAPFIKIQKHPHLTSRQKKSRFGKYDPARPLVPQILANDPDEFLILDKLLHPAGYPVFNWNLGCPVPMVTKKKRGSGLLPFPDMIRSILEHVLPKLKCRLSIKARLGLNHAEELLALIPIFNQFPIEELIIHPRLGQQLYRGHVDLPAFAECLRQSRHPVTYNGDIFNYRAFSAQREKFPRVRRWMLGRGILVDPFLPGRIKGADHPAQDKLARLKRFHDACAAGYGQVLSGPAHLLDKLKEFWSYQHFLFVDGPVLYRRVLRFKRYEEYGRAVEAFFAQAPELAEPDELTSEDFR